MSEQRQTDGAHQALFRSILPRTEVAWAIVVCGVAGGLCWWISGPGDALFGLIVAILACLLVTPMLGEMKDSPDAVAPPWLMRFILTVLLITVALCALIYVPGRNLEHCLAVFVGAAAAFVVGACVGFIFGVPRALQDPSRQALASKDETDYVPNTNLEQISDWLTKIVVGISLVQFSTILSYFNGVSAIFAKELGSNIPFVAGAILLFYAGSGFLIAYLWTRLRLLLDLATADYRTKRGPEYYEGLMNAYLYNTQPQGFEKVIELGEQYLSNFRQPNPRVHLYLACAYGQEYDFVTQGGKSANQYKPDDIRDLALKSAAAVLDIDPSQYGLLLALWKGEPNGTSEDDLHGLINDEKFKKFFNERKPSA